MAGYVFQYLPCYTVGPDAYDRIPEVCGRFGEKAVAIGGHKALAAAKPYLERALSGSETSFWICSGMEGRLLLKMRR